MKAGGLTYSCDLMISVVSRPNAVPLQFLSATSEWRYEQLLARVVAGDFPAKVMDRVATSGTPGA
jgi:hypothetical protein